MTADRGDTAEQPTGIRVESSVRSLHSCGLVVCTADVYWTNQTSNTEVPHAIQILFCSFLSVTSDQTPFFFLNPEKCSKTA